MNTEMKNMKDQMHMMQLKIVQKNAMIDDLTNPGNVTLNEKPEN